MDYKELKKNFDSIFADNEQAKDFAENCSKMAWKEFINSGVWGDCCESVAEVDTSHSTLENAAIHPTESASYCLSPNEPHRTNRLNFTSLLTRALSRSFRAEGRLL